MTDPCLRFVNFYLVLVGLLIQLKYVCLTFGYSSEYNIWLEGIYQTYYQRQKEEYAVIDIIKCEIIKKIESYYFGEISLYSRLCLLRKCLLSFSSLSLLRLR